MKLVSKTLDFIQSQKLKNIQKDKEKLLDYLYDLKSIEASLWGVNIKQLKNGEEEVLENSNHLIYIISKKKDNLDLVSFFKSKEFSEFLSELELLKEDFKYLKKKIRDKNKLKDLISNYTIKSVNPENYEHMKNIFLLEKKLYEEIEVQDKELEVLFKQIKQINILSESHKVEVILESLKHIRDILAGHQDLHYLWESERLGFSNTSNLIYKLIKTIENSI